MKDVGLVADSNLTPAERAVSYLLMRVRHDPNLRYLMLDTQAFQLLIEAEATRIGEDVGEVKKLAIVPHDKRRKATMPLLRDIYDAANECISRLDEKSVLLPGDECIGDLHRAIRAYEEAS